MIAEQPSTQRCINIRTDAPIGSRDLDDYLDGLVVKVAPVATDKQRALGNVGADFFEGIERRLHEILEVMVLKPRNPTTETTKREDMGT